MVGYITYFPQLIAGPILRPRELLPQLKSRTNVTSIMRWQGITIFTIGLVKKLVFADQIAPYVDAVYAAPDMAKFHEWLVAIYGFFIQIYCDFSGYTDMAIGIALILGVRLPVNFDRPYSAKSFTGFWRRWHITLSAWFRDYLYIPLGGSRCALPRRILNVMVTMTLCGLWHGAGLTFLIWGALHGFGVSLNHAMKHFKWRLPLPNLIKTFLLFHVITLLWIPFRANDISNAIAVCLGWETWASLSLTDMQSLLFPISLIVTALILHPLDRLSTHKRLVVYIAKPVLISGLVLAWILAITLSVGSSAQFIYFDF